jgi:hypothetical protein
MLDLALQVALSMCNKVGSIYSKRCRHRWDLKHPLCLLLVLVVMLMRVLLLLGLSLQLRLAQALEGWWESGSDSKQLLLQEAWATKHGRERIIDPMQSSLQ